MNAIDFPVRKQYGGHGSGCNIATPAGKSHSQFGSMAEFAVLALAPREDLAVGREGQAVFPTGIDGHLKRRKSCLRKQRMRCTSLNQVQRENTIESKRCNPKALQCFKCS